MKTALVTGATAGIGAATVRALAKALEGRVDVVHVPDAATALGRLRDIARAGDAVLVKGSNGVGLSRLVAGLGGGIT